VKRALLLLVLAGALVASAFGVSTAGADQTNNGWQITLFNCSPGPSTYQTIAGYGIGLGGLSVVGSNMQYKILTQSWTDDSGFHSVSFGKADANRTLVTCHYLGPISGLDYTNVGFFTPVGK
jgi:hypothetical protein